MVRIAFAGFRHPHINLLYKYAENNPDVEIVAAYEKDPAARAAAQAELNVKFTHDNMDEMLKEDYIDVVAIGDYYSARGPIAIAALKAGKHVYADKPLCISQTELDEIEDLARQKGLKVGCMLDLRQNKVVQPVYDFIRGGNLGEIHAIFFGGQHPLMYGTRAGWYFEEGKHGGTINDIAVHGIDLVEYLTGLSLKRVIAARCWNAFAKEVPSFKDCAQFMAELSNGAGLMADVSYAAPNSSGYTLPFYWRFTFWGTKGVMEFSSVSRDILVALDGKPGSEIITAPDIDTGDCLSVFLDELKGKKTYIDTESVFRVTRDTLKIQEHAGR
ncbi:MAG TPA: Gfo/Idh/MocA family oxidoreductase [Clostridiaceae bacterium]|jgi:predicted dehydrogenase|nr:Gfo/Idh/MocA family oxidoreductase [Clostridiaceae bacterium]